jgi:glycosyltransferase involved in cell wall biosynthesis
MASLYDSADIYINATNIDNMPGSFIECLAYGLPIVSTDAGGIPYVVTHGWTALLVGLNDHEALAREALRLIEEPGLAARLATNGREEYGRYTWDAVREAWVETYGELKRSGGPASSR